MRVAQCLAVWQRIFAANAVQEPAASAKCVHPPPAMPPGVRHAPHCSFPRLLLTHALQLPHGTALRHSAHISPPALGAFHALAQRRLASEPLQNLLQRWDFRQLRDLLMVPPTLIPRPETETLADLALAAIRAAPPATPPLLLDVGCGSGALGLSIAEELGEGGGALPTLLAVDVAPAAVAATATNALACGLSVRVATPATLPPLVPWLAAAPSRPRALVLHGDVTAGATQAALRAAAGAVASEAFVAGAPWVVCNPPYIERAGAAGLHATVVAHEDGGALFGDAAGTLGPSDGLDATRAWLRGLRAIGGAAGALRPSAPSAVFLELGGPEQVEAVAGSGALVEPVAHADLAGVKRFLCGTLQA